MKFSSRQDPLFIVIIYGVILITLSTEYHLFFGESVKSPSIWFHIVEFSVVLLLLSLIHRTRYKITPDKFSYVCGPFFGSIKVDDIKEIVVGKTLWVGMRPATARNGLIIKCHKHYEIYISPKTNESFIEELLKHNPSVKITS